MRGVRRIELPAVAVVGAAVVQIAAQLRLRHPGRAPAWAETRAAIVGPQSMGRGSIALIVVAACTSGSRTETPARAVTELPGTAVAAAVEPPPSPPVDAAPPRCADGSDPYAATTLRERVTFLASPALGGRAPGSDGDRAARDLVAERFRCLGLLPAGTDGTFTQPFTDDGDATANVIGYVKGADPTVGDEIVYLGAHLDHLGDGHLGANDNASGVTALLAVAQAIVQRATPPRRTIAFGVFGAEERGMRGSYFHVAHPPDALPLAKIVQFINLDMVGTHASRGLVAAMGTFRGLAATPVVRRLARAFPRLHVALGGVSRGSDFEPFCKRGVPYVFFWTPDRRCYHRTCDTADRLDYPRMADITALAGALAAELADSDADLAGVRARRGCGLPR